jgi:long-chain acyl-CoA synthetase
MRRRAGNIFRARRRIHIQSDTQIWWYKTTTAPDDADLAMEKYLDISAKIAGIMQSEPDEPVMEWKRRWWTKGQLAVYSDAFEAALNEAGIGKDMAIALAARNRPTHCFIFLSLLANARPISMLYAFQAAEALARDLRTTRFAALVLDEQDWSDAVAQATAESGTIVFILPPLPDHPPRIVRPEQADCATFYRQPGPGVEILSSGTTGMPKRVFHPHNLLFRSINGQVALPSDKPTFVFWPLSGIGGSLALASAMVLGVPFVLLEKFVVEDAVDAIERHQLTSLSLTPTMVRMIYDANVAPERLASLETFFGGSGPLDPDLHDKMEARYGKPVIWAMGATEFCGTIIAWSLDLHRAYSTTKRGSAGRVLPGCAVRIIDPETGDPLPTGAVGRMDVRVDAVGPDWIITNDLARIDQDGFVFFKGRADGAIIRGGFKIVPEKLCETLRLHPQVGEAAVVGVPDDRLGHVPVAIIEPKEGEMPSVADLDNHMRSHLAAPQIPVHYFIVEKLPYTASTKVSLREVKELVAGLMATA